MRGDCPLVPSGGGLRWAVSPVGADATYLIVPTGADLKPGGNLLLLNAMQIEGWEGPTPRHDLPEGKPSPLDSLPLERRRELSEQVARLVIALRRFQAAHPAPASGDGIPLPQFLAMVMAALVKNAGPREHDDLVWVALPGVGPVRMPYAQAVRALERAHAGSPVAVASTAAPLPPPAASRPPVAPPTPPPAAAEDAATESPQVSTALVIVASRSEPAPTLRMFPVSHGRMGIGLGWCTRMSVSRRTNTRAPGSRQGGAQSTIALSRNSRTGQGWAAVHRRRSACITLRWSNRSQSTIACRRPDRCDLNPRIRAEIGQRSALLSPGPGCIH